MQTKAFYKSKTLWGALVLLGASILPLFGVNVNEVLLQGVADNTLNTIQAVEGLIGSILVIWGRKSAETKLGWSDKN